MDDPRPWADTPIRLEQWKQAELRILRGIARRVQALSIEHDDLALTHVDGELRELLVEWHQWRQYGIGRGWQP